MNEPSICPSNTQVVPKRENDQMDHKWENSADFVSPLHVQSVDCLALFRKFMVFEDYGHASLLGNRLAVHEAFDGKPGAFRFFSQFSGSFVVCKTGVDQP